jgi:PilZ domain-containing protein
MTKKAGRPEGTNPMNPESKRRGGSESSSSGAATGVAPTRIPFADVQGAARFPLELPVSLKSEGRESLATTQNISSNGVLFQVDAEMPVGSRVEFTIVVPADVVGSDNDVRLDCRGRVVRNYESGERRGVGVVIDEYHLERH